MKISEVKGFSIKKKKDELKKKPIIHGQRSQCRSTHKRQDC